MSDVAPDGSLSCYGNALREAEATRWRASPACMRTGEHEWIDRRPTIDRLRAEGVADPFGHVAECADCGLCRYDDAAALNGKTWKHIS